MYSKKDGYYHAETFNCFLSSMNDGRANKINLEILTYIVALKDLQNYGIIQWVYKMCVPSKLILHTNKNPYYINSRGEGVKVGDGKNTILSRDIVISS